MGRVMGWTSVTPLRLTHTWYYFTMNYCKSASDGYIETNSFRTTQDGNLLGLFFNKNAQCQMVMLDSFSFSHLKSAFLQMTTNFKLQY